MKEKVKRVCICLSEENRQAIISGMKKLKKQDIIDHNESFSRFLIQSALERIEKSYPQF